MCALCSELLSKCFAYGSQQNKYTDTHIHICIIFLWNTAIQDLCTLLQFKVLLFLCCMFTGKWVCNRKLPLFFHVEKAIFFSACVNRIVGVENFILMSSSVTGNMIIQFKRLWRFTLLDTDLRVCYIQLFALSQGFNEV